MPTFDLLTLADPLLRLAANALGIARDLALTGAGTALYLHGRGVA